MLGDGGDGVDPVVSGRLALRLLCLNTASLVLTQATGSVSLLKYSSVIKLINVKSYVTQYKVTSDSMLHKSYVYSFLLNVTQCEVIIDSKLSHTSM